MKLFSHIHYRQKLLLSYVLFAAFMLILVFSLLLYSVFSIVSRNTEFSSEQSISQVSDYIHSLMDNHSQYVLSLSYSQPVWKIVSRDVQNYPVTEQLNDKALMESVLKLFENERSSTEQFACSLFLDDRLIFSTDKGPIRKISSLKQTKAYQKMQEHHLATFSTFEPALSLGDKISTIHLICDQNDYQSRNAAIILSFPADVLRTILTNALPTPNSACVLWDRYGDLVLSIGVDDGDLEQYSPWNEGIATGYSKPTNLKKEDASLWLKDIPGCDWVVSFLVPDSDIMAVCRPHIWAMGITIFLIGTLLLLLSSSLSKAFAKRIELLTQKITSELNTLPTAIHYDKQEDDIDCLFEQYNAMVNHIDALVLENKEKTKNLHIAELNLLHVQINPHFLFNSLDMLHWMLVEQKYDLVSKTIDQLSNFYRIGLSKGQILIPLRDELTHIQSYIDIQNLRFDRPIHLEIDVPESFMNTVLPRITLQPIVENAIIHGLQHISSRSPKLSIMACQDGNDLVLSVCDNGVGIPKEKLSSLLAEGSQRIRHYGLYNTNKRIQMLFSDKYGLSVYSIPNYLTKIDIRLPLKQSN